MTHGVRDEAVAVLDRLKQRGRIRPDGTTAVMAFSNFGGEPPTHVDRDAEGNEIIEVGIDRKLTGEPKE